MINLPKLAHLPSTATTPTIHFSPILVEVALLEPGAACSRMKSSADGLSPADAASRPAELGPNVVVASTHRGRR